MNLELLLNTEECRRCSFSNEFILIPRKSSPEIKDGKTSPDWKTDNIVMSSPNNSPPLENLDDPKNSFLLLSAIAERQFVWRQQQQQQTIQQNKTFNTFPINNNPRRFPNYSFFPDQFLGKFDIFQVQQSNDLPTIKWFIGNQLAQHLQKENYNLYRSLARKEINMKRASKSEFAFLLSNEMVKHTVRCVTLIEVNGITCDYIVAQMQKIPPRKKREFICLDYQDEDRRKKPCYETHTWKLNSAYYPSSFDLKN